MRSPVSSEWLEAFAPAPEPTEIKRVRRTSNGTQEFDLAQWLTASGLNIRREKSMDGGGTLWEIHCPWRPADGFTAWVSKAGDDVIRAGCRHDTCPAEGWRSLRKIFEPGWDDTAWVDHEEPRTVKTKSTSEPADESQHEEPDWMEGYRDLPFPYEVLPPAFREFIKETAISVCVHPDMVATFMLPTLGALIGNSRELGYKTDWQERCRIWAAVVADPGAKKSPALKRALSPIGVIQRRLNTDNGIKKQEWLDLSDSERKKTPEPPWKQIMVDNTTLEALAGIMKDHPRGVLMKKDELTGWVESHGQYKGGKGDERQQYLSFWSGDQIIVNRKGDGKMPLVVDDPHFNVVGGIQPEKVHVLIGKDDDGLAYRFLYSWPPSVEEKADTPPVSYPVKHAYEVACGKLYDLPEGLVPTKVKVTEDGRRQLIEQAQRVLDEKNHPLMSTELRGYWAKFEAYHLRLVLILTEAWHAAEDVPEEVDATMAELGESLISYFKGQAIKIFGDKGVGSTRSEADRANPRLWSKALHWMDNGHEKTTLRALMKNGPWRNVGADEARKMILTLEDRGEVVCTNLPKNGLVVVRSGKNGPSVASQTVA